MSQNDLDGALAVIEAYIIESKYPAHEDRLARQHHSARSPQNLRNRDNRSKGEIEMKYKKEIILGLIGLVLPFAILFFISWGTMDLVGSSLWGLGRMLCLVTCPYGVFLGRINS